MHGRRIPTGAFSNPDSISTLEFGCYEHAYDSPQMMQCVMSHLGTGIATRQRGTVPRKLRRRLLSVCLCIEISEAITPV